MKKDNEDKFEEKNLNDQIKKMKRRSIFKTLIISLIVSIVVIVAAININRKINLEESKKALEEEKILTELSVPNGYIFEASYDFQILGGKSEYKLAKEIGPKSVVLKTYKKQFGLWPGIESIYYGSSIRSSGEEEEIGLSFWENGYRKMIFYHPHIEYKEYKNDLKILEEISDGKIIEMGISFDKVYRVWDIDKLLPNAKISWIGLDMFADEYMKEHKYRVETYDSKNTYIDEANMLGVSMLRLDSTYLAQFEVEDLFELLEKSPMKHHNDIYKKYYREDRADMPNMMAAIVYGTREELMELMDNPNIKASSIGLVEDLY